jgi:hypothetical protein
MTLPIAFANVEPHSDLIPAFVIFWILLSVASFCFFHFHRGAKLKRRIWPILIIGTALLFVAFSFYFLGSHLEMLVLVIPAVALVSFINLRKVRFCDSCGRTLYQQPIFRAASTCPCCGKPISSP